MKHSLIASLVFAAGLSLAASAQADTLAYPSPDKASFMIDYPSSWDMTPGESTGDYLTLLSDGGTTLMLRTLSEDVEQAVKESILYVKENYTNVSMSDPEDSTQQGMEGFYTTGTATDADLGDVKIAMAWYALKDGTVGEIWFVAPTEDSAGIEQAGAILDSFRGP